MKGFGPAVRQNADFMRPSTKARGIDDEGNAAGDVLPARARAGVGGGRR